MAGAGDTVDGDASACEEEAEGVGGVERGVVEGHVE